MPKAINVKIHYHFGAWSNSLIIGILTCFILTASSVGTALYLNYRNNRLNSKAYNYWLVRVIYPVVYKTIDQKLREDPNAPIEMAKKEMAKQNAIIVAKATKDQARKEQRQPRRIWMKRGLDESPVPNLRHANRNHGIYTIRNLFANFKHMKFDVFSLIVLLGSSQALFFSVYLFFSPAYGLAQRRLLAFFIFILSYNGFETLNWSSELFKFFPFFELFSFVLIFGLGPCIYLYLRSFRVNSTERKNWPHFSLLWSMLLLRLCILTTWLFQVNGKKVLVDAGKLNYWFCAIAEPLSVIVFTTYVIFAIHEYRTLVRGITQHDQEEKTTILRWLKTLLIALCVFNLIWVGTVGLPFMLDIGDQRYYVIEISLVIFIYWIGYAGYHRSRIIYISQQKKTQSYLEHLEAEEIEKCIAALDVTMEKDKLYLNAELNLNRLAAHIGVTPKTLSAVLNQVLQKGFSEYVNSWRVEAVKQMLLDPGKRHLTITGIAYDCGFNSQPTFQRAFKAVTGYTPSDFYAKHYSHPELNR